MTGYLIRLYGDPQPQGNKTAFAVRRKGAGGQWEYTGRVAVVEGRRPKSQAGIKSWRGEVREAAVEARGAAPPLHGPVGLRVTFTLRRPKAHYGTGRNSEVLRAGAPAYPTTRPDGGKLQRAIEDALRDAGVYDDDAQVVQWHGAKVYPADSTWPAGLAEAADPAALCGDMASDALASPGVVIRVWPIAAQAPQPGSAAATQDALPGA